MASRSYRHEPGDPRHEDPDPRLSVMEWLLGVGHGVARKLRGIPKAPMVRLHPPG